MNRKIGKARQVRFNKMILAYFHEIGAVKDDKAFLNEYNLDTKAGKLCLTLHEEHHTLFSIFARFEDVKRAKEVIIYPYSLNQYSGSGKWNFHCSDEMELFDWFQTCIEPIITQRPITKWERLDTDKSYEGGNKLIFEGHTYESDRASVDEGKPWNKPKHVKVIMVDATACFVQKSTPFQFWPSAEYRGM